ncbi:Hypothetical protein DAR_34 [Enterococcus phage dArtagnan]|uniref:Uncharacterized protein n=2 Tax=Aramisvirus TaxID=3152613 RepID=A0A8D6UEJ8_9CAUD|nr:Hypothetical protein ARAMI_36 [Enterococcus phage Aramis]CAD7767778.1 Hypothetical protein DAR_34 [Enterococcus phage dArtagnan]
MNENVLIELNKRSQKEVSEFEDRLSSHFSNDEVINYVRNNLIILLSSMTISDVPSKVMLDYILSNTPHK